LILPKYYFRLNDPRKWKGSYFCSSQQSLYSILVRKSTLLFCISPLQVLQLKRGLYIFLLYFVIFISFSLYLVNLWKICKNEPRKWKGSYFCSSQQSLYSILVRKSALLFCISPLQVLETKWPVKNFLPFYRPHFESKSTQDRCLYAQNRKSFQKKTKNRFLALQFSRYDEKYQFLLIKS